MAKKNTEPTIKWTTSEPTVSWTYNNKPLTSAAKTVAANKANTANTANAAANNQITFNPYGTTYGKYASYSSNTIPVLSSKYDTKAENMATLYKNTLPYKDPYAKQYSAALSKVLNPEDYKGQWDPNISKYLGLLEQDYDPNSDANYIAYKNQYLAGGQKAMQDTLAQAAALTGGYGSSYANSAAQQTYGEYTAALANKIPELAQAARQMYMDNLNVYLGLDERDYGRYRDKIGDNYNILGAVQGASDMAYGRHQDTLGNVYNLYGMYTGLGDRDYNRAKTEYEMWAQLQAAAEAAAKGSGGRSGSGSNPSGSDSGSIDFSKVYNQKGLTKSNEGDWIRIPGVSRMSASEVEDAMKAGYIGYWTDDSGKDHYVLTDKGKQHYGK